MKTRRRYDYLTDDGEAYTVVSYNENNNVFANLFLQRTSEMVFFKSPYFISLGVYR